MKKIIVFALLCFLCLSFVSCVDIDVPVKETESGTINDKNQSFYLNETAIFTDLKFTATEIEISEGNNIYKPKSGYIYVGVKFVIENISENIQSVSSFMLFDPYIDDVKTESIWGASLFKEGGLDGDIAPGKKMVGWYLVEAPKNWKKVELQVRANWLSQNAANFVFKNENLSVEESVSDESGEIVSDKEFCLNETGALDEIKVTATNFKISKGDSYYTPFDGNVYVAVEFVVENTSGEEKYISGTGMFDPYVDDVKCEYSIDASLAMDGEDILGRVASGKKISGWYYVEVPEDFNKLEIFIKDGYLSDDTLKFIYTRGEKL